MHETQIVPCSIHHSDHDDLIVFYHKMNDVGVSVGALKGATSERF